MNEEKPNRQEKNADEMAFNKKAEKNWHKKDTIKVDWMVRGAGKEAQQDEELTAWVYK